jgi:hypothetical protein
VKFYDFALSSWATNKNVYDASLVAAIADLSGIPRESFERVMLSVDKDKQGNLDFSDVIVIARTQSIQRKADLALNLRGVVFGTYFDSRFSHVYAFDHFCCLAFLSSTMKRIPMHTEIFFKLC